MIAKLIQIGGTDPHQRIRFQCPGCKCCHEVPVPPHPYAWGWNGDLERPTLTPSILVRCSSGDPTAVCHSFVTDGKIAFCGDSTHALAGQTVPLEPWD